MTAVTWQSKRDVRVEDVTDAKAKITPYKNGPYLIRGEFEVVDQDGNPIEIRRRTIALCRCGASRMKPFCDGTHKAIGFRTERRNGGEAREERLPSA